MRAWSVWALALSVCLHAEFASTSNAGGACQLIPSASERLRCFDAEGRFDFAALVRRELECDGPPRAAEIIKVLIRRNAVSSLTFQMDEGMNYFALQRPEKVDGLTVVAVFAYDDSGRFPFLRSRGNSRGAVFGIVTRDDIEEIDRWRLGHSPALLADDSRSSMIGATDIGCFALTRRDTQTTAREPAPPAAPGTLEENLNDAGSLAKRP